MMQCHEREYHEPLQWRCDMCGCTDDDALSGWERFYFSDGSAHEVQGLAFLAITRDKSRDRGAGGVSWTRCSYLNSHESCSAQQVHS
jgi:hypothetical protein